MPQPASLPANRPVAAVDADRAAATVVVMAAAVVAAAENSHSWATCLAITATRAAAASSAAGPITWIRRAPATARIAEAAASRPAAAACIGETTSTFRRRPSRATAARITSVRRTARTVPRLATTDQPRPTMGRITQQGRFPCWTRQGTSRRSLPPRPPRRRRWRRSRRPLRLLPLQRRPAVRPSEAYSAKSEQRGGSGREPPRENRGGSSFCCAVLP